MENQAETLPAEELPATEPTLSEAVVESKEAIANAAPVKRRGRPKKNPDDIKKEVKKENPAPAAAMPPPDYLKPVINFPFQAMALKTGWEGWNLSEEEKLSNAVLLDLCLKRYLPQLQSEHAELAALALGLGMAAVSRYMAYNAYLNARRESVSASDESQMEARPENKSTKRKIIETPKSTVSSFLDNGQKNHPQI